MYVNMSVCLPVRFLVVLLGDSCLLIWPARSDGVMSTALFCLNVSLEPADYNRFKLKEAST